MTVLTAMTRCLYRCFEGGADMHGRARGDINQSRHAPAAGPVYRSSFGPLSSPAFFCIFPFAEMPRAEWPPISRRGYHATDLLLQEL